MTTTNPTKTRRFTVYRRGDLSETHNANQVNPADQPQYEGVVFSDGTTVVRWLTAARSTSVWADFETLWKVHGHDDANSKHGTVIVWHDADDLPMWGVEFRNGRWLDERFKTKQEAEREAEGWLLAGGMAKRLDDPDGPHPLYRATNATPVGQAKEIERLRAEAKRADEEATTLANSDLATTEQVVRALRAENERLRAEVADERAESERLCSALEEVMGACGPACRSDCDAYYVAKRALNGEKE